MTVLIADHVLFGLAAAVEDGGEIGVDYMAPHLVRRIGPKLRAGDAGVVDQIVEPLIIGVLIDNIEKLSDILRV